MKNLITLIGLLMAPALVAGQWQKHAIDGTAVAINMGPWACATDTKTGLTWEVKSWHEDIHYYKATYSYYQPQNRLGIKDGGSCQQGQEWYPCDVSDLITQLNQQNYCGINHWRLPTVAELKTLVYHKNISGKLLINPYIFPRTTRNIYMSADIKQDNGKTTITMMDFWHQRISERPLDVVANVRLVADHKQNKLAKN